MKQVFTIIIVLYAMPALAQKTGNPKLAVIEEVSILNGNSTVSAAHSLSALFFKNGWGFGAGAGIDYYKVRSVPVFLSGRKEFGKTDHHLFGYAQLGYNIALALNSQHFHPGNSWSFGNSRFRNGVYSDFGIGYALLNKKRKGLEFSMGYSLKTLTESYTETIIRDFPPYGGAEFEHSFRYSLNRLALKVGFRF
jgi:hypothetical protein